MHLVLQTHHAACIDLGMANVQRDVPVSRRHQLNPLADEDGDDMDIELVELTGVWPEAYLIG